MFRIFFLMIAVAFVCARDWVHYTGQNDVRDVVLTENGTLWAAFAWGLQERLANKREYNYMPGSNNLQAADFVQLFAIPGGDIIAASKNGILVRKNKNSQNFEIINNAFAEKKRNLLKGLGKRAENILVLPFEGAIAFFDYEQNRSVITIEMPDIKRVAVRNDSIWLDLNTEVLVRKIDWKKIYDDRFLADPSSWKKTNGIPFEEVAKRSYVPNNLNFPLEKVRTIAISSNGDAIAWGNEYNYLAKMQNDRWGEAFWANQSGWGYPGDQKNYSTKSLALLPNGNFAIGIFGPGIVTFNNGFPVAQATGSFYNSCPTEHSNAADAGWTIVQGLVAAPNYSGYFFSYPSEGKYGLGFLNNNSTTECKKITEASSPVASSIIVRSNENGDLEIYVAWTYSLGSKTGGIDFYLTPQDNFSPAHQKKWVLKFESPIDFAFDSREVLWAISSNKIFYLDKNADEWKEPSYIRGFGGGIISGLATDAQNGLWISTLSDGAYSFSQINNSPDSLMAKRYKIKDGLLNELVYDIAIDTIRGKVYFAHDLGLSVFSTPLVRSASGFMQDGAPKPIAYPNPFRPGVHNFVKIDYINENSSVYILDSSGKRVRFFKGSDLRGGVVIWDGKNGNGKSVAPGLYYYLAVNGKNIAKGKILVER